MTRRLSLSLLMLAAGVGLLLTAGFARPADSASAALEARKGGTLRIGGADEVDSLDPAVGYSTDSFTIAYATCAKLFNYPDAPGAAGTRLVPEVVDRFTVSKDGRTYTFELKRTFRFHTGAPVTARSFADAFNRVANPKLGSPATTYMREIVGATAVIDGQAASIAGVRALGRYRLQIRLTRPVGDFTARLTLPFFCPILPSTPIDPAGIDNPAGSGPYYIAERIVNQRMVMKRNPYYRGARPANVDQVIWATETIEACALAVAQDRTDVCASPGVPPAAYRELVERYGVNRPGGQLFVTTSFATWFFAFNHRRAAFKGPGQRPLKKAINFAIDRPEMARAFFFLAPKRTDQILPPALSRAAAIYPLAGADPATAKRWLARARLQPQRLVLYALPFPAHVKLAQILTFNLEQVGIEVDVKYFNNASLAEKLQNPGEPFDIALRGFTADYADAAAFLPSLLSPAGGIGVNLENPKLDVRMEALSRLRGEARRNAWADFELELMRDDPPVAPFVHARRPAFVSRSLGCFLDHPVYGLDIAAVCKK